MESINILQLQETESELIFTKLKNEAEQKKEEEFNKLLQQKEKDLVLAAELGKALLEKMKILANRMKKWRKTLLNNWSSWSTKSSVFAANWS